MVLSGENNRSNENEEVIEQIRVSFRLDPSINDPSLQVPKESIAVPATIRRSALSTVINHLLDRQVDDDDEEDSEKEDNDDENKKLQAISFDFLIGSSTNNNQQLLRTSVQTAAKRLGLSFESDIILTYFPALQTPSLTNSSPKIPDWISCMSSVSSKSESASDRSTLLCTGSYDGNVRVYNTSSLSSKTKDLSSFEPIATLAAHQGPVKCLALTTTSHDKQESFWIATGSLDQTLVVQQYQAASQRPKIVVQCQEGHTSSIGSVAFPRFDGTKSLTLASGDWDGGLCIWDLQSQIDNHNNSNPAEEPSGKKQKSASRKSGKQEEPTSVTATPKYATQAHTSQISGICWSSNSSDSLITGSWDHSLKLWHVERQDCLLTLNGSRVVTCLDASVYSPSVVVTGHPDCTIRLWDVRNPELQQPSATTGKDEATSLVVSDNTTLLPSHKAWITQVQWSRSNPYQLASTSHDGTLKLWDIRSTLPLSTVRVASNQQEKALCLCYEDTKDRSVIFTGGTDGIVNQYRI